MFKGKRFALPRLLPSKRMYWIDNELIGLFVVTITSNNKNIKAVTLCDLQGRILKNIDVNSINTPFDISNYQSGTYLLIIKTDYETSKSKLVIE